MDAKIWIKNLEKTIWVRFRIKDVLVDMFV